MTTFAIGDIHGNLAALEDLLDRLSPELTERDEVVFLGDYIDRGPSSRGCIDRILQLRSAVPAKVVTLMGNHEEWLLKTLHDPTKHSWVLGMEAFATIESYSTTAAERLRRSIEELGPLIVTEHSALPYEIFFDEIPATHVKFLESLKPYHRVDETVFVHAGLDPAVEAIEKQSSKALLWGVDEFPKDYKGPELVVYGHHDDPVLDDTDWPTPRVTRRTLGLDTISHGVLTAVALPERRIVQSARHVVSV